MPVGRVGVEVGAEVVLVLGPVELGLTAVGDRVGARRLAHQRRQLGRGHVELEVAPDVEPPLRVLTGGARPGVVAVGARHRLLDEPAGVLQDHPHGLVAPGEVDGQQGVLAGDLGGLDTDRVVLALGLLPQHRDEVDARVAEPSPLQQDRLVAQVDRQLGSVARARRRGVALVEGVEPGAVGRHGRRRGWLGCGRRRRRRGGGAWDSRGRRRVEQCGRGVVPATAGGEAQQQRRGDGDASAGGAHPGDSHGHHCACSVFLEDSWSPPEG